MKEWHQICETHRQLESQGTTGVLATVVEVSGSSYRAPGARMLITPDRKMTGTLGAGCFEEDLLERSQAAFSEKKPYLVRYDTTGDEDIVWGLGLGCKGVVEILLEPLTSHDDGTHVAAFLEECLDREVEGRIATVFSEDHLGGKLVLQNDSRRRGSTMPDELADEVEKDLLAMSSRRRWEIQNYGETRVLLERIRPISLLLLGGGPDAPPLVGMARELGWKVTVCDHRPVLANEENFPRAHQVIHTQWDNFLDHLSLHSHTACVIMTHHYMNDEKILTQLLDTPAFYLAIVGSRKRREAMLKDLAAKGVTLTDDQRQRLYSPAGLDIGSDSPQEIALSVVAEIQAVLSERKGTFLRDRTKPIHAQPE